MSSFTISQTSVEIAVFAKKKKEIEREALKDGVSGARRGRIQDEEGAAGV